MVPARVVRRRRGRGPSPAGGRSLAGPWLWTTRSGSEGDLAEELGLLLGGAARAARAGPALVTSARAPVGPGGGLEVTFARHGFRLLGEIVARAGEAPRDLGGRGAELLLAAIAPTRRWALDAWVPDTDATNPHAPLAAALAEGFLARVAARDPTFFARRTELRMAAEDGATLVAELCLAAPDRLLCGVVRASEALTLAPGGRSRMHIAGTGPSRAARKLEEVFAWLGLAPGPGELCVDLGAAPGGWSWLLLARGARVVAVDPARLGPALVGRRGLRHVQASAFAFEPLEPADWLLCDMAWRPLEVAKLLARWGRRGWASFLVANLKLPMKRKAEMVMRLRAIVAEGGWRAVRTRQLYHDRDEVTLVAHR
jgi:23S rRNA (cytidine2498-2'-O)-methyltransferase